MLFEIIEKAAAEQVEITLVFSYIREYMLDYITELLDEINRWCEEKRQSVEIVVNDWGMASLVKKSRRNLIPSLGILLNKRRFHLEKTACIFRSIRPIPHSIVLLVQYVKQAREDDKSLQKNARDIVRNMHFCIRNICI